MNHISKNRIILIAITYFFFSANGFSQTYITKSDYPLDKNKEIQFYNMTPDEATEYQTSLMRQIADLALIPPVINTSPPSKYDTNQQAYVMALSNEITPKGRHWVAWIGGEDGPKAFLLAAKSDDNGNTWSRPCLVIDAHLPAFPVPRSVIIGNFRTDPVGRLWLFFDQAMNQNDGRDGLWATICKKYNAQFVDNRRAIATWLATNNEIEVKDLLRDEVHNNDLGRLITCENIGQQFVRNASPAYDPYKEEENIMLVDGLKNKDPRLIVSDGWTISGNKLISKKAGNTVKAI